MSQWMPYSEIEAAYDRVIAMSGRRPVAIEVHDASYKTARLLFSRPDEDREPFGWFPANNETRGLSVYLYTGSDE